MKNWERSDVELTGIDIRQIREEDLANGFLNSLDSLRRASDIDQAKAGEILQKIRSNPNHVIFVAVSEGGGGGRIVGSATLLIEPKFIHDGGVVGHIEDVAVDREFQGQKIGRELVLASLEYARKAGCYKTVLDCSDDIRPFYERLGFEFHSNTMRFNH